MAPRPGDIARSQGWTIAQGWPSHFATSSVDNVEAARRGSDQSNWHNGRSSGQTSACPTMRQSRFTDQPKLSPVEHSELVWVLSGTGGFGRGEGSSGLLDLRLGGSPALAC